MPYIVVLMIAVSLSMDAFSLSLAYGTLNLKELQIKKLSAIVGVFHFFMPLIGLYIGEIILKILPISTSFVVAVVLTILGLQMIFQKEETEIKDNLTLCAMLIFALAVSIDSLSLGIGLRAIYNSPLISASTFMIVSAIFTYVGLEIGKKASEILGKLSEKIGGIFLILLAVLFYLK